MKQFITLAVSVAILGLGATTARGAQTYPGTMCVSNSYASLKYAFGRVSNASSATITIECPAVSFNPNGGVANDARVFVVDQNFLADAICSIQLRRSTTSGPSGYLSSRGTSGTNATPQVLRFAALSALTDSTVNVVCSLPAQYLGYNSILVGYQIN